MDTMNAANSKNDPVKTVQVQGSQPQEMNTTKAKPSVPFELQTIIDSMGELFMQSTIVRQSLDKAQNNVSITPEQKKLLKQAVVVLDSANKQFIEIPNLLSHAFQM